jgi:hypothetical protein
MTDQATTFPSGPSGWERRSRTFPNRLRRKLNDYWLIPLLICYLQLSTQFIYPAEPPLERLYKGNRTFFQGIPIFYKITTHEFPYTLMGHFYEIAGHGLYRFDIDQVPHRDLRVALESPEIGQQIYDRLTASRRHRQSELGGILTVSYHQGDPSIHLHEITSLNEIYLGRLKEQRHSVTAFRSFLSDKEAEEIFEKVGVQQKWKTDLVAALKSERLTDSVKWILIDNFIDTFEALSESRYLLSPYQFKEALGKIPFGERVVGLYHFHNGFDEPPSPIDVEQSLRKRQIVMTLNKEGWTLYDVVKEDLRRIDIDVDKTVALQ